MNDAASKPINLRADFVDLGRSAAGTAADGAQFVRDTVVKGVQSAGDGLAELREKARTLGANGMTSVRESGQAVADHPVVFGLATAAVFGAGYMSGRNEDKIAGTARKVVATVKEIPGTRLAKDAGLVAAGAALSIVLSHACKASE